MELIQLLRNNKIILTEGSVIERIRRNTSIKLDDLLANALLIYDDEAKSVLTQIYRDYIDIGKNADVPILILTPTWRANQERISKSGFSSTNVNEDNYIFLNSIRKTYGAYASKILIGGLIGCANDAYNPNESLSVNDAEEFHSWQLEKLSTAGVDFFIVSTLPNINEAEGIARTMSKFNIPFIISFVIRENGTLLDGTPLHEAIQQIDSSVNPNPSYYMVNCVHPTVFNKALENEKPFLPLLKNRIIGIQANTSAKSPEELEGISELQSEEPEIFAEHMYKLHKEYGFKILGGCCGTDERHIKALAEKIL